MGWRSHYCRHSKDVSINCLPSNGEKIIRSDFNDHKNCLEHKKEKPIIFYKKKKMIKLGFRRFVLIINFVMLLVRFLEILKKTSVKWMVFSLKCEKKNRLIFVFIFLLIFADAGVEFKNWDHPLSGVADFFISQYCCCYRLPSCPIHFSPPDRNFYCCCSTLLQIFRLVTP